MGDEKAYGKDTGGRGLVENDFPFGRHLIASDDLDRCSRHYDDEHYVI